MKSLKIPVTLVFAALALVGSLVAGCSMSRWARVESGEYTVLDDWSATGTSAAREIQTLEIERDQRLVVLTLDDGSQISTTFQPRDRPDWPSGCPTNINSTRMEVLEIVQDPLTIGATTISRPILVRDCPPEPTRIVLRGDGAIGGGGGACAYPEPCIRFTP